MSSALDSASVESKDEGQKGKGKGNVVGLGVVVGVKHICDSFSPSTSPRSRQSTYLCDN